MCTRHEGTKSEKRVLDAYIKLRRAVNAVNGNEELVTRSAGLTESQFGVLEALFHLGPSCQRELAVKILKSAGNLTTVIDNLEKRDLVKRRREAEDRRIVIVSLTPEGRRLISEVYPRVVAVLVAAFSHLTAREQDQMASLSLKLGKCRQ